MTSARLRIIAFVAVLALAIGWIAWDLTHTAGVRNGWAFGHGEAYATLGMTTPQRGDEVWYLSPAPKNVSKAALTLEKATPATTSPGLEYIDTRIYKRAEIFGAVPLGWGTRDSGPAFLMRQTPSKEVRGFRLQAGQEMTDEVIFLHFRVTTDQRPLETSGVRFEYTQKNKTFHQVLPAVFRLENRGAS